MTPEQLAELEAAAAAAKQAAEAAGGTDAALNQAVLDAESALTAAKSSQDPLATELERTREKTKRTEAEKAAHSLKKNAERAQELGLDPAAILGIRPGDVIPDAEDETRPMTVGDFRRLEESRATKTALELAELIEDPKERELTKEYLGRVRPSGDPQEDLRFARLAVNSVKSGQILEEIQRTGPTSAFVTGPGAPARPVAREQELTADELYYTRPPWNMTREAVIAARPKT